jgi:hypothetical protein
MVAVLVVLAVKSHPRQERTLERHRSENPEDELDWANCLERSVCEESMKADSHPEHCEQIHPN